MTRRLRRVARLVWQLDWIFCPVSCYQIEQVFHDRWTATTIYPRGLRYWRLSIQAVLVQLAEARDYARDVGCDRWQYAVEIEGLTAAGVSVHDLWELVSNGYIEHARGNYHTVRPHA